MQPALTLGPGPVREAPPRKTEDGDVALSLSTWEENSWAALRQTSQPGSFHALPCERTGLAGEQPERP